MTHGQQSNYDMKESEETNDDFPKMKILKIFVEDTQTNKKLGS
jgi:hypothetical protein